MYHLTLTARPCSGPERIRPAMPAAEADSSSWMSKICEASHSPRWPTAVRAAVLPGRAVYLVADGSGDGLRRAAQEACTRWDGMTEPIIPVKPGGDVDAWCEPVVSLARADRAVNVGVDPGDAAAVVGKMGMDLWPVADIDRTRGGA